MIVRYSNSIEMKHFIIMATGENEQPTHNLESAGQPIELKV